jgi:hypothetical protein
MPHQKNFLASPLTLRVVANGELTSRIPAIISFEGDVRIWPADDILGGERSRPDALYVSLDNPKGHVVLQMSRSNVASFLRRSECVVPSGTESDHLDFDSELALLTRGGPAA